MTQEVQLDGVRSALEANDVSTRSSSDIQSLPSKLRASSGLRKDLSSPLGDVIDADLIAPIAAKGSASDSDGP